MNGLTDKMANTSINSLSEPTRGQSAIVALKGLPQTMVAKEKLNKSDKIRKCMVNYGKVSHICSDGSANCLIEFEDRSAIEKLFNSALKMDSNNGHERYKLVVDGHETTIWALTEEEEKDYWIRVDRKKQLSAKKKTKAKNDGPTTDSRTYGMKMDTN